MTLPPLERDPRYRLIDVGRGVACLMVVLHHAGFALLWSEGQVEGVDAWLRRGVMALLWWMMLGVPLFFVISGYCIAASADATRRRGAGSLSFLTRRIWRIYPPYWAALLGFAAVTGGLESLGLGRLYQGPHALRLWRPGELDAIQWLGNLTLTEEWRPLVWGPPGRRVYTRIAWSLCYEEQFYFVCFALLLAAPRRLFGALAAVTAAAIVLRVGAQALGATHRLEGAFPMRWHEFAVGVAVYWRLNVPAPAAARRAVEVGLLGLLVAGLGLVGRATPVGLSTATAAAFGLALIGLRRRDEQADGLAWLRPLRACGRRCYSIYLVHLPVCTVGSLWLYERGLTGFWARVLVTIPLVSLAAVGASWAFFWVVERHFLNPPLVRKEPQAEPGAFRPHRAGEPALALADR